MQYIHRRPKSFAWIYMVEVENGRAKAVPAYEGILTDQLTTFATDDQQTYFQAVKKILSDLQRLDEKFGVPGLSLSATDNYQFDILQLKRIGDNDLPIEGKSDRHNGTIDTGVDERGRPTGARIFRF